MAEAADRAALIDFIRDHWSAKHVFVHQPEVFDWQYGQPDTRINMVLAEDLAEDGTATILGVLGFIPMGRFDPALGDRDLLLALWKVREDLAPPGLGLRLLKSVQSLLSPRLIGAIGISDMVGPIYKALGYQLDKLHHAALFDPARSAQCLIAAGVPEALPEAHTDPALTIRTITPADHAAIDAFASAALPAKSMDYIRTRYADHPWYDYQLRLVERDGAPVAVVVWRAVQAQGSAILRIVDIIGDTGWLAGAAPLLLPELARSGAEYFDVMQCGVAAADLAQGGWLTTDDCPGLILPNYFAPFESRNVTIALSWKCFGSEGADLPVRLFRADSDQDRPNEPTPLRRRA